MVVLANYGFDAYLSKRESGCVALRNCAAGRSEELVSIPPTVLGIGAGMENGADAWDARSVWGVEDRITLILEIERIRPVVTGA